MKQKLKEFFTVLFRPSLWPPLLYTYSDQWDKELRELIKHYDFHDKHDAFPYVYLGPYRVWIIHGTLTPYSVSVHASRYTNYIADKKLKADLVKEFIKKK